MDSSDYHPYECDIAPTAPRSSQRNTESLLTNWMLWAGLALVLAYFYWQNNQKKQNKQKDK